MKLIRSRGSQLSKAEEEIESLRKENHELRQDNRTLRAQLARVTGRTLPKPVARNSTPQRTSGPSSSNGTTPPYAQPTRASSLRDVTSTSPTTATTPRKSASSSPSSRLTISTSTGDNHSWIPTVPVPVAGAVKVNGKDVLYDNGEIKVIEFGFLKSTQSHTRRVAALYEEFPHVGFFRSSNDTWGWEPPATKTQHEKHHPATKFEVMPQTTFDALISRSGYEKRTQRAIETRTRLSENQWITGMSSSVYINHDRLWEIAREALEVAKRCVFRWFCTHRRQWFNYLFDIDFGRDSITGPFSIMPYTVRGKLENLIRLRNRVCHFSGSKGEDVDSWDRSVKDVHEFAILLLDEEGAREARGLRD